MGLPAIRPSSWCTDMGITVTGAQVVLMGNFGSLARKGYH